MSKDTNFLYQILLGVIGNAAYTAIMHFFKFEQMKDYYVILTWVSFNFLVIIWCVVYWTMRQLAKQKQSFETVQQDFFMFLNLARATNAERIKNELSYIVHSKASTERIEQARRKEAALLFDKMQKMHPDKIQEVKELVDLFYK